MPRRACDRSRGVADLRKQADMRTVPLGGKKAAGRVALVDDEDYDLVMQFSWYIHEAILPTGSMSGPYAMTNYKASRGGFRMMHNLIMGRKGIDHINHDGLDNRRSNLRPASQKQQLQNRRKQNTAATSVFKGVHWDNQSGKWAASLIQDRQRYHLGFYVSEAAAARAYDAKAVEVFGEFACLNFPEDG